MLKEEMFEYIANETDKYVVNHPWNTRPRHDAERFSTISDKVFLALFIFISIVQKLMLISYWNKDPENAAHFLAEMMLYDWFLACLKILYFNSGDNNKDRLHKTCLIIDEITENFRNVYIPVQDNPTGLSLKIQGVADIQTLLSL